MTAAIIIGHTAGAQRFRIWHLLYAAETPTDPFALINHSNPQIPTIT